MRQLDESAVAHQQAAVILERLSNRLDEHDRRIATLESRPDRDRQTLLGVGNLSANALYVVVALVALALSLAPHLTFH
jgi:porphobilinogen deaminase